MTLLSDEMSIVLLVDHKFVVSVQVSIVFSIFVNQVLNNVAFFIYVSEYAIANIRNKIINDQVITFLFSTMMQILLEATERCIATMDELRLVACLRLQCLRQIRQLGSADSIGHQRERWLAREGRKDRHKGTFRADGVGIEVCK